MIVKTNYSCSFQPPIQIFLYFYVTLPLLIASVPRTIGVFNIKIKIVNSLKLKLTLFLWVLKHYRQKF